MEISNTSEEDAKINSNGSTNLYDKLENLLAYSFDKKIITNAIICKNTSESHQLWDIRERAAESEKKELKKRGAIKCLKHDISLPLHNIEKFHNEAQDMLLREVPSSRTIYFGHLGEALRGVARVLEVGLVDRSFTHLAPPDRLLLGKGIT